jgi:hypothetical protein
LATPRTPRQIARALSTISSLAATSADKPPSLPTIAKRFNALAASRRLRHGDGVPLLTVDRLCAAVERISALDPMQTPDPLTTMGGEPTLRRCLSNDTFAPKPAICVSPSGPAEPPQTTGRDGVAGVASALCQTAASRNVIGTINLPQTAALQRKHPNESLRSPWPRSHHISSCMRRPRRHTA